MLADLDAPVIALYVRIDDFLLALPPRTTTARPPQGRELQDDGEI